MADVSIEIYSEQSLQQSSIYTDAGSSSQQPGSSSQQPSSSSQQPSSSSHQPSSSSEEQMHQQPPQPPQGPPKVGRHITSALDALEGEREVLLEKQTKLMGKYQEFVSFFIQSSTVCVLMMAGGLFIGYYLHSKTHGYIITALVTVTYILLLAMVILTTRRLVVHMDWNAYKIGKETHNLRLAADWCYALVKEDLNATPTVQLRGIAGRFVFEAAVIEKALVTANAYDIANLNANDAEGAANIAAGHANDAELLANEAESLANEAEAALPTTIGAEADMTAEEAAEAQREAVEARQEATNARQEATDARQAATDARTAATDARTTATDARTAANDAWIVAAREFENFNLRAHAVGGEETRANAEERAAELASSLKWSTRFGWDIFLWVVIGWLLFAVTLGCWINFTVPRSSK